MNMKNILLSLLLTFFTGVTLAGEFSDNCVTSLAAGLVVKSDCSSNSIVDGKTYCFGNPDSKKAFDNASNKQEIIAKAAAFFNNTAAEPVKQKISSEQARTMLKSASANNIIDFSGKDLSYQDLSHLDLRYAKFVDTNLFGSDLRGSDFTGADMRQVYLNIARIEGTNFSGANLSDAIIFQPIFGNNNFSGANLSNARVIGTLGKVDMQGANLSKGRLGLDVGNQPMGQMKFDSVSGNFANANFEGADLNIAGFSFANLSGANLRNTNLYRADLVQADLTGADLTGANLQDADVDGATFTGVKGLDTIKGFNTVKGKCRDCK